MWARLSVAAIYYWQSFKSGRNCGQSTRRIHVGSIYCSPALIRHSGLGLPCFCHLLAPLAPLFEIRIPPSLTLPACLARYFLSGGGNVRLINYISISIICIEPAAAAGCLGDLAANPVAKRFPR